MAAGGNYPFLEFSTQECEGLEDDYPGAQEEEAVGVAGAAAGVEALRSGSSTGGGETTGGGAGVTELNLEGGLEELQLEGEEEGDQADQVPWACAYCGVHNPATVVKCNATGKWFCNSRGLLPASCIVYHLVRSKHKAVTLNRDSPLGETVLECYVSGVKNVFQLGFVPVKQGSENVVALLTRDPETYLKNKKSQALEWDLSQWQPIIQDKLFVSWLVQTPSEKELLRARRITTEQVPTHSCIEFLVEKHLVECNTRLWH